MPTDIIFPPQLWPSDESVTLEDTGTAVFQPILGGAITQRIQGSEPRMVVKQTYRALSKEDRAQLLTFLREVRGGFKSFYLSPSRYTPVGSQWVPTEVFSNNTFANAGSGWFGLNATLSPIPGGLRVRNTKSAGASNFSVYQNATVNSSDIYALRSFTKPANFANPSSALNGTYWLGFGANAGSYAYNAYGMQERAGLVSSGTTAGAIASVIDQNGNITRAGDYIDIQYASLARCLLVDGDENLIRNSTNTSSYWTQISNAVTVNSAAASPGGTTTAFLMGETAVTTPSVVHGIGGQATVSSLVGDYAWSISIRTGSFSTHARVYLEETQAFGYAITQVEFATGSFTTTTNVGWNHLRGFVSSEGNGWWRVSICARKVSSKDPAGSLVLFSHPNTNITAGFFTPILGRFFIEDGP
jgi:hypothetical protein